MSRGLRNNNPGNIRLSATKFLGEVPLSSDGAFKEFISMDWGYRAMFVLLNTYQKKYGLNTIRQFIGRYAPASENNTDGYVDMVARWAEVDADQIIDVGDRDVMCRVVAAMSRVENGVVADHNIVRQGWDLFDYNR